jgi:hypothetical protein
VAFATSKQVSDIFVCIVYGIVYGIKTISILRGFTPFKPLRWGTSRLVGWCGDTPYIEYYNLGKITLKNCVIGGVPPTN